MRICALLSSLLCCISASGQVHLVEISPEGAIVHRTAEASVLEGRLIISNLPLALDSASIQVNVVSPSEAQVSNFRFVHLDQRDNPRHQDVTASIQEIAHSLVILNDELKLIEARSRYELELAESVRESLKTNAAPDAFELGKRAWEEYSRSRHEAGTLVTEISTRVAELERKKQDLQEQLQKIQEQSGQLLVNVTGADDGAEVTLELSYHVRGASWSPLYEVRASPDQGTVTWVCKAQIRQNTGEDWDQVKVRLSTTAPQFAGMPELQPLYLGQIFPRDSRDYGHLSKALPLSQASKEDEVQLERSTTSFHAVLPGALSLESGPNEVVREIFNGITKASFWSEAVPELSPDAWLMAGGALTLDWPVLESQALIFIDGHLVAKRFIESLKPGEEFKLSLGKNESIAIKRTERRRNASEGGVFDRTRRVEVAYETVVSNFMPTAHRVILQDRFPVPRENKIQVRHEEPKNVTAEEGTGIFRWEREIQSGAKATMITRYVVSYPAEWTINGDF